MKAAFAVRAEAVRAPSPLVPFGQTRRRRSERLAPRVAVDRVASPPVPPAASRPVVVVARLQQRADAFIRFVPSSSPAPVQAAVAAQKIRIRLKSFEVNHMAAACDKIIAAAEATEAKISGPVPLPTKRRIYCVLRSPHVNKDSREHFETRTHHRLIDVHQPTAQTIDALMGLELPAGVEIEVKL